MTETEKVEETEEKTEEVQTTEASDTTEYTKDQQALDFEKGNAARARQQVETITEAYDGATAKVGELEKELESLKVVKDREQDKLDEMDPDIVDQKVIKNIELLQKRMDAKDAKITELMGKASQYEQERADAQATTRQSEARENVLTSVESSLKRHGIDSPGQYRNEALKLADEKVDTGEVKQPTESLEAIGLMEECYLEVKIKHEEKAKTVSVDGGKSGAAPGTKVESRKTGTLDEIYTDMLSDKSWKSD